VGLGKLPWPAYLSPGSDVAIRVTCERSRLWHSGAVRERLLNLLEARFKVRGVLAAESTSPSETDEDEPDGEFPNENEPDADLAQEDERDDKPEVAESAVAPTRSENDGDPIRIFVRMHEDEAQVSVDAAGERLHRRGYRKMSERASLRETLAGAMIFALGGRAGLSGTLWDPFCGAGTIPLEALARSRGGLAQPGRPFTFWRWPSAQGAERTQILEASKLRAEAILTPSTFQVIGSDVLGRAIRSSELNLRSFEEQFGSSPNARFLVGDVLDVASEIPEGAFILSNPPYGHRLGGEDTLQRITKLLRKRPDLRPCAFLVGAQLKRDLPGNFEALFQTQNGGLPVALRVLR
jgi:putative N6-adenine-specific DNA methylase